MSGTTSNPHQNQSNPYFHHIDRAPYEFGCLLQNLPERTYPPTRLTKETFQKTEAAVRHAQNGISTLLWGLDAIGALMIDLGANPDYEMDSGKVAGLGSLIQHVSVEVQFLQDTSANMQEALDEKSLPLGNENDTWRKVSPSTMPVSLQHVDVFIEAEDRIERAYYDASTELWHAAHDGGEYPLGAITYWRNGSRPSPKNDQAKGEE
jgi:hypothetical protein